MRFKLYLIFAIILLSVGAIIAIETSAPSEVNVNLFRFIYDDYNGATTDFDSLSEAEVNDASDVVLENTLYGKIEFLEDLNLFEMKDINWTVNFNQNINISSNLINVNQYLLPGINKSAELSIYGISFVTPVIYNKGVVCSTCTEVDYVGGVYSFTTDVFEGPYYLREGAVLPVCGNGVCETGETTVNCPADCSVPDAGGGGGGAGGEPAEESGEAISGELGNFTVNPGYFSLEMRKGTYFQKIIEVNNTGNKNLTIGIIVEGELVDFVFPSIKSFILEPGDVKPIRLDIYVSERREADIYLGKILFVSGQLSEKVEVVLDVNELAALFDIRTNMLKKYINPGGRARANITIINMGDLRNFDVVLNYKIIDFDKNEYTIKEEQFAIEKIYNNIFYLDVPEDLLIGDYVFYAKVLYPQDNVSASSFDTFTVENISFFSWIILIILILILMYLAYRWYKNKKLELSKVERKETEIKVKAEESRKSLPEAVPILPE